MSIFTAAEALFHLSPGCYCRKPRGSKMSQLLFFRKEQNQIVWGNLRIETNMTTSEIDNVALPPGQIQNRPQSPL